MQKFAKTAAMSNFLHRSDITSRCPNDSITVCIFARQLKCRLNVSSKIHYIKHLFVLIPSRNQKKIFSINFKANYLRESIQETFLHMYEEL